MLPIDILVSPEMDLLNDLFFEDLLRLCVSGLVSYCGASPPCEFSLLKLRPPGPKPIRTYEFPLGIPDPAPHEQQRLLQSRELLHRAVRCLQHVHAAGGHGHLEAPPNAFTWYDPVVQSWLNQKQCQCVVVAACSFDLDISKHWLFACSHEWFCDLAGDCTHSNHQPYAGLKDSSGSCGRTAEYPTELAKAIASRLSSRLSSRIPNLSLNLALSMIPTKQLHASPHALHDGGGKGSQPDWSFPPNVNDSLKPLRDRWIPMILGQGLHKEFLAHTEQERPTPPFSEECISRFRDSFSEWLPVDWSIRHDQPICLAALKTLSQKIHDPDSEVFSCLIAGVSAGTSDDPIVPSKVFWVTSLLFRFIAGIGSLAKTIRTSQRNSFKQNLIKVGFLSFQGMKRMPNRSILMELALVSWE